MAYYSEIPANHRFMGMQTKGDFFAIDSGSPAAVQVPDYIGQLYIDIANGDAYMSIGPSSGDWKKITP